ncbi:hypothetical protein [Pseudomonas hygromyciniae]|uniref:hypothetical protein n=1 Tax=Pseudomonas hygromyciniae TaxID=2812000 RepID=UPI001F086773|nr:hypothetical protein [Pseudomonas hygromyciniae]
MRSLTDSRRPLVVALLMTVVIISVLDKTIFAFAGPQIIDELKLTPAQFGFISSSFFFSIRSRACWWLFSPAACRAAGFSPAWPWCG